MNYGLRYTVNWRSPMRGKHKYTLFIYKRGYEGDAEELPVAGEVMSLQQGERDADELMPILSSELAISLMCLEKGEPYAELYTLDPLGYKVLLTVCRADSSGNERCMVMWQGFLANGQYSQPYANPPYRVSLTANDGMAYLKSLPYADASGNRFTDTLSIRALIQRILDNIEGDVYIWPYERIKPIQGSDTFDAIGLSADAIYSAFGETTPSCYDVLTAVLSSFGLQLFQSYGRWEVRQVYSLVNYSRPEGYQTIAQGFGDDDREVMLPLYDKDNSGRGMMTSATMSMLRPLRAVSVEQPSADYAMPLRGMADPSRWRNIFVPAEWSKKNVASLASDNSVLMTSGNGYRGKAYLLDGVYTAAKQIEVSVSFDIWNRQNRDTSIRVGLFAIDASADPYAWAVMPSTNTNLDVQVAIAGYLFGEDEPRWEAIPKGSNAVSAFMQPRTSEVAIAKSTRNSSGRVATWTMAKSIASISMTSLPDFGVKQFRLMLVIYNENSNLAIVQIGNPQMQITQSSMSLNADLESSYSVSAEGVEDITYTQSYTDRWLASVSGDAFKPTFIDVSTNEPVQGFVTPSLRGRLLDVVAGKVKSLRGDVLRQLEGELVCPEPIDFNSLFSDGEGRVYRPLYVNSLLQRGCYDVQLREVLPLRERIDHLDKLSSTAVDVVALDSSAVYVDSTRLSVYRFDAVSGKVTTLRNSLYKMWLSLGYNCVCVIEEVTAGDVYNLYAYDDNGELLTTVLDVYKVSVVNATLTAEQKRTAAKCAKYHTTSESWVLIANVSGTPSVSMHSYFFDKYGNSIADASVTQALGSVVDESDVVMTSNGYFVNAYSSSSAMHQAVLRCDFAEHALGDYAVYRTGAYRVVGANDKLLTLVQEDTGWLRIYSVKDSHYQLVGIPIMSYTTTDYEFVAMNSALILLKVRNGDGGMVFDTRTPPSGAQVQISPEDMPLGTITWLSGVDVWNLAFGNLRRKRIRVGEDDSRFANYITSEGYRYVTADGRIFTVKQR